MVDSMTNTDLYLARIFPRPDEPLWEFATSVSSFFDHGLDSLSRRFRVEEIDAGYRLTLDLPGVKREDLDIELAQGLLTVKAKRGTAVFQQSVNVGEDVDGDRIEAALDSGVLTLIVPTIPEPLPRKIEIKA